MKLSRRQAVLGAAGLVLNAAPAGAATAEVPKINLRLLGTSDLHMFGLDWDYYLDRTDPTVGLVRVASLIEAARNQTRNTLLFDNGDILQGSPMGDYVATVDGLKKQAKHPFFVAMNILNYDAATLGNHEFNFGLNFLGRALEGASFPFVCANVVTASGERFLPPYVVLKRTAIDEDGDGHELRIGVIGFVPPQIMVWDKIHLAGKIEARAILDSAREHLPALRASCDVLVALCHSGIGPSTSEPSTENVSDQLAQLGNIDAIFTGHSHRVFPGPDYAGRPGVDAVRGALWGVPAVMPGFWGSHLGVIDLKLERRGETWQVADFASEARPIYRREQSGVVSLAPLAAGIATSFAAAHQETLSWVSQPVGETKTAMTSYFVWAGQDPVTNLINDAQLAYAERLVSGTNLAGLPILSAAAPFRVGYTPDAYIDLPAGPLAIRDIANLYIYSNSVALVRVKGAIVAEWLEHAVRVFLTVDPKNGQPQPLLDPRVATYNFDAIEGLEYEIDLTSSPRTNGDGRLINQGARRIRNLRHLGAPLDPDRDFLVVTNNYRAGGGGRFPGADGSNIVLADATANRDALIQYVQEKKTVSARQVAPWRFASGPSPFTVSFESSPKAAARAASVPNLRHAGPGRVGYDRFELIIA